VATVVDHVIPHRGDPVKMWDESNWESICAPHHNSTMLAPLKVYITTLRGNFFGSPLKC